MISSIPLICLTTGSRVIDPVPIVRIPVTLASPFTNKLVPDAPTAPTSNENLGLVVPIPTLETVLMPASVFSHKLELALIVTSPVPVTDIFDPATIEVTIPGAKVLPYPAFAAVPVFIPT